MKSIQAVLLFLFIGSSFAEKIKRFEVKDADVNFVTRLLNEISELSIISSPEAGKAKTPAILLKNKDIKQILSIICKTTNLAYSFDKTLDVYTIQTLNEYRDGLKYSDVNLTRHFKIKPLNLEMIGNGLEELYGNRLYLSYGLEVEQEGGQGLSGFGNSGLGNSNISNSGFGNTGNLGSNSNQVNNTRSNQANNTQFSRNVGSNSRGGGRRTTTGNSKRFELDFTTDIALDIEKIKQETEKEKLQEALGLYLSTIRKDEPEIVVTLNQEHSQLTVRTVDTLAMKEISDYIAELNKDVPQILLEMKILELTLGDGFTSSFDYQLNDNPNPGDALNLGDVTKNLTSTLTYNTLHSNLQARIQLLKNNNQLEVLATPILMSANNRHALFNVVDQDLLLEGFSTGTRNVALGNNVTGTEVFSIPDYTTTNIGLSLSILPRIIDKNKLTLTIQQSSSDKKVGNTAIQFLVGDDLEQRNIDIRTERSITQTVKALDGKTIAVGGLVDTRNETKEEKVPILGDIPLLDFFFKEEVTTSVKTELILLITPHIIYSEEDLKKSKDLIKKLSDHKFHEGGQKIIDGKNTTIKEYRNPTKNPIRDFVRDPKEILKR